MIKVVPDLRFHNNKEVRTVPDRLKLAMYCKQVKFEKKIMMDSSVDVYKKLETDAMGTYDSGIRVSLPLYKLYISQLSTSPMEIWARVTVEKYSLFIKPKKVRCVPQITGEVEFAIISNAVVLPRE